MVYLAKEPVYTIMLIGRWSSDAFLAYIEKQIKEFTKGVSTRMLQNNTFFNLPLAANQGLYLAHHRIAVAALISTGGQKSLQRDKQKGFKRPILLAHSFRIDAIRKSQQQQLQQHTSYWE